MKLLVIFYFFFFFCYNVMVSCSTLLIKLQKTRSKILFTRKYVWFPSMYSSNRHACQPPYCLDAKKVMTKTVTRTLFPSQFELSKFVLGLPWLIWLTVLVNLCVKQKQTDKWLQEDKSHSNWTYRQKMNLFSQKILVITFLTLS